MYNNFFSPPMFLKKENHFYKQHNNETPKPCPNHVPQKPSKLNNDEQAELLFEIFGLKIYFDDLLLICILLFLYQEGIHDEYLFIALILLLLS